MTSKADYLKKYLSADADKETHSLDVTVRKKKKKVKAAAGSGLVIHDEDAKTHWGPAKKKKVVELDDDDETPVLYVPDKPYEPKARPAASSWVTVSPERTVKSEPRSPSGGGADISPPRRRQRHDSDNDMSPPRKKRHDSDNDMSPPRRQRHDADNDMSPPRKKRHDSPADQSPPRRKPAARHDSPDLSPPRKSAKSSQPSTVTRARHDSPDLSPPRKTAKSSQPSTVTRARHDSPDLSPPRKTAKSAQPSTARARHDSPDNDLSPPRKPAKGVKAEPKDISPPRKPAARARHDSPDDDLSPPRKPSKGTGGDKDAKKKEELMSTGNTPGLHSGDTLRQQNAMVQQQTRDQFLQMDPSLSGKGAETVHRARQPGRKKTAYEEMQDREAGRKNQEEEGMVWGRGVAQDKEKEDRKARLEEIKNEPFARYADDPKIDEHFKDRERWDDPMKAFIKPKSKSSRPLYKGACPPNRFGIRPGHRWDGVDRSNGFENRLFAAKNTEAAQQREFHAWATEDM